MYTSKTRNFNKESNKDEENDAQREISEETANKRKRTYSSDMDKNSEYHNVSKPLSEGKLVEAQQQELEKDHHLKSRIGLR